MSRIGKQPITIPKGVTVTVAQGGVIAKGPKGELKQVIHSCVKIAQSDDALTLTVIRPDNKEERAIWGTSASLIKNIFQGVTQGYQKQLEIIGTGFKVALKGQTLSLSVGFTNPVEFLLPQGISAVIEKNIVTFNGIDKQLLGEIVARIKRVRPPDAYKGVGIRFAGEVIKLKPGKQAKTAGAAA